MKKIISFIVAAVLLCPVITAFAADTLKDKNTWTITASSQRPGNPAGLLLDGDTKTIWHSYYEVSDGKITGHDEPPFTITIKLPAVTAISGFSYTPRQDSSASGRALKYNAYISGVKVASGDFANDITVKTIEFEKNYETNEFALEFTSTQGGYGTGAELDLLAADSSKKTETPEVKTEEKPKADTGKLTNKSEWKITASSQMHWAAAEKMIDDDLATYWHTKYEAVDNIIVSKDMPPFTVDITLPEKTKISGFYYIPRQEELVRSGRVYAYNVYAVDGDKETFIASGRFNDDIGTKAVVFSFNIAVTTLRLEFTETFGGYGVCAELDIMSADKDKKSIEPEEYEKMMETEGLSEIPKNDMKGECELPSWTNCTPQKAVDGVANSIWQTEPSAAPYVLDVDMGRAYDVESLSVLPRQTADFHGLWLEFTIAASVDGVTFEDVKTVSFPQNLETRVVNFENPVHARYLEFVITKTVGGRASCAELTFYENYGAAKRREQDSKEKYILHIGNQSIESHKDGKTETTEIDVAPFIENGRTMIPLRGLLEEMGAEVSWDGDTQMIELSKDGGYITMQIMYRLIFTEDSEGKIIRYTTDVPPKIKNGRTFVPIRFISEQLGYTVDWNNDGTVTIEK